MGSSTGTRPGPYLWLQFAAVLAATFALESAAAAVLTDDSVRGPGLILIFPAGPATGLGLLEPEGHRPDGGAHRSGTRTRGRILVLHAGWLLVFVAWAGVLGHLARSGRIAPWSALIAFYLACLIGGVVSWLARRAIRGAAPDATDRERPARGRTRHGLPE